MTASLVLPLSDALLAIEKLVVDALLPSSAAEQYAKGAISKKVLIPFVEAITRLSSQYVATDRAAPIPLSRSDAIAYALYYLPINFAKLYSLLQYLPPSQGAMTMLDFGAGPGTCSLAALLYGLPLKKITLVDSAGEMLKVADILLKKASPKNYSIQHSLSNVEPHSCDLICAANVLNELQPESRATTIGALMERLSPTGSLILIEPALSTTTRTLMEVRNNLLSSFPSLSVWYPCTHSRECSMLKASLDEWCHGTLRWEAPPLVEQLDVLTGFNKHRIKYSAFVLSHKTRAALPHHFRIITEPEKVARGISALVCGDSYYGDLLLPKKDRNDKNRLFQRCHAYNHIAIDPIPIKGTLTEHSQVILIPTIEAIDRLKS